MTTKFNSASAWLLWKIQQEPDFAAKAIATLLDELSPNDIQKVFHSQMQVDGYFEEDKDYIPNPAISRAEIMLACEKNLVPVRPYNNHQWIAKITYKIQARRPWSYIAIPYENRKWDFEPIALCRAFQILDRNRIKNLSEMKIQLLKPFKADLIPAWIDSNGERIWKFNQKYPAVSNC